MSRYDVLGRLSCSDCHASPSSNETYIPLSVPANRSPACLVSSRITRAKLPRDYGKTWTAIVHGPPTGRPRGRLARVVRGDTKQGGLPLPGRGGGQCV